MIAAFMSTHDSYLLCWSSVLTNDVVVPLAGDRLSERRRVFVARGFVLIIGVLIFLVSFLFPLREDLWDFMAVTGAIYTTGAFAVLLGGLYWKRASSTGAVLALITGSSAVLGLGGIQEAILHILGFSEVRAAEIMGGLTGARIGLTTVVLSLVAMVAGSLLFPDKFPEPGGAEGDPRP